MATLAGPGAFSPRGKSTSRLRVFATRLDWPLLLGVLALLAFSTYVIDIATAEDVPGNPDFFVIQRAVHIGIGLIAMVGMYFVQPHQIVRWSWVLLGVALGALTMVFLIGSVTDKVMRGASVPVLARTLGEGR